MTAPTIEAGAPIIEAADIHKTYSSDGNVVQALRGVSMTIRKGEMVAVMGPSGCGKTTLLNTLSGLDSIDRGLIRIEGQEIAKMPDNAKTDYRARRMGFVFQFYNLLPVLSSIENVELPLLVSGVAPRTARERGEAALARVGLADWAGHRPAQLSGGQRQRVTIARALVNEPAIVWGDEPTGDLDSVNAGEVMDLIQELNETNTQTFVIVTHDAGVGGRCHRVIRMVDGQIVGEDQNRAFQPQALARA